MKALSARDRHAVMLGAGVIGLSLLTHLGLPAWRRSVNDAEASALEAMTQREQVRQAASERGLVAESLDARRARFLALAPRLIEGSTPVAAGAAFAARVSGAAAANGLSSGALELETDTASSGIFTRVGVRGTMTGDVVGVAGFLRQIERGPLLLVVRELAIEQPEPGAPQDQQEALRISFWIEGLAPRARGHR